MNNPDSRIFVAGHKGMVGSAVCRRLADLGCTDIVTRTRDELDLCNHTEVNQFFESEGIDQVYLAAAKVGGILANNNLPADFISQNLAIETNVISRWLKIAC